MKLIMLDYEERIVEVDGVAIYVLHFHKTAFFMRSLKHSL